MKIETQEGMAAVYRAYRVSEARLARELTHPLAGYALTLSVRATDVAPSA